jgi:hypothetical protein
MKKIIPYKTRHKENVLLAKKGKKKCGQCHNIKDLSSFGKNKSSWDGLMRECRECRTEMHKEYYHNPKCHEKQKEYSRNYYKNYTKRIPVIVKKLKTLFEIDSRAVDEFIKTDLFQDILKTKTQSKYQNNSERKTNKQVIENILTEIDCLLIDGGLSGKDDDALIAASDLIEKVGCETGN